MDNTLKGACIFGQSGGPTAVINASAYGVIKTALENPTITPKASKTKLKNNKNGYGAIKVNTPSKTPSVILNKYM